MDLAGHTVIPGLVGMHEHLFYPGGGGIPMYNEMAFSFPRLYLASGVTTARTAGSLEPYTDLNVKSLIDSRPHARTEALHYRPVPGRQGQPSRRRCTNSPGPPMPRAPWTIGPIEGVTSFKAYMNITRAELKAAVDAAHKRGIKVTGPSLLHRLPRSRRHRHR